MLLTFQPVVHRTFTLIQILIDNGFDVNFHHYAEKLGWSSFLPDDHLIGPCHREKAGKLGFDIKLFLF